MATYAIWNNKGGVGKSYLTFQLACEYARVHPTEWVLVVDFCPQANSSGMLFGGMEAGEAVLEDLSGQTPPRTISGYIEDRITSPYVDPHSGQNYVTGVSSRNPHVPPNVDLVAGDEQLEIQASRVLAATNPGPTDAWRAVHTWASDLIEDIKRASGQGSTTVFWGAPSLLGHGLRENPMSPGGGGMVRSRQVKGAGSAPTEGARRATGVGADAAAMGSGALAPGQRWSASRKRDVVLRLLRSEPLDAVSREVGVEVYRLERWKVRALAGLERGLKEQAGEPLAAELDAAKRHIGELSMDNELLRSRARAAERRLPLATRRSRR